MEKQSLLKQYFLNIFVIFAINIHFCNAIFEHAKCFCRRTIKRYYYIVQNTYLIPYVKRLKATFNLMPDYMFSSNRQPQCCNQ